MKKVTLLAMVMVLALLGSAAFAADEIVEKYNIPGKAKQLQVHKDSSGQVISITDEQNNPAQTLPDGDMEIKFGDFSATIIDVPDGTTFVTKHNPTCRWVYKLGKWYYICV